MKNAGDLKWKISNGLSIEVHGNGHKGVLPLECLP